MMHDPVDKGRRQLIVPENHAPFAEFDIRRDYQAPSLIAIAQHLEQKARAFLVQRHVSELVDYEHAGFGQIPHQGLQCVFPARPSQGQHQPCGSVEPDLASRLRARQAHGDGEVGLAPSGLPVEHEVLRRIDEGQRLELVHGVALGRRHLGEIVVVERFYLREPRPFDQALPLVGLATRQLLADQLPNRGHLAGCGRGQKLACRGA